jgi:outer membrane protein OmpA-like peptidoglycan-associated protein
MIPANALPTASRFAALLLALSIATAGVTACKSSNEPQSFEKAAAVATDSLVGQTGKLPSFLSKIESTLQGTPAASPKRGIVLDPMLDMITGQQTETTLLFERRVTQRMAAKFPQFEFLPFTSANLTKAQYLLTGTMTRVPSAATPTVNLNLALTDIRTGVIVAQASALAKEENLDSTPSRYYKDSPVLIKDKVVEGYAKTTATPPGQKADPYYMERVGVGTVITEATTLYNAERYQDALGQYKTALATPQGQQLRAESGVYLSSIKLGNTAEAEQAFGRIVALGIAYNELGVKFLFAPGSVDFWADPKISGAYQMWLRQIARGTVAAGSCMTVVGHTSKSGPAAVNDALSLKRAATIKQKLVAEQPVLASRTSAEGMGFRQNIVGSGTDNSFDVLDRRVEFKIVPCR